MKAPQTVKITATRRWSHFLSPTAKALHLGFSGVTAWRCREISAGKICEECEECVFSIESEFCEKAGFEPAPNAFVNSVNSKSRAEAGLLEIHRNIIPKLSTIPTFIRCLVRVPGATMPDHPAGGGHTPCRKKYGSVHTHGSVGGGIRRRLRLFGNLGLDPVKIL